MRKFAPFLGIVAVLALSACAQATRWERAQTSDEAAGADLEHCRTQANQEAMRAVGPYPMGYPFYGPHLYRGWRYQYETRLRQEQYFAENRLTSFCMRNKGYERVVIEDAKQ